jgi:hypothetical protein
LSDKRETAVKAYFGYLSLNRALRAKLGPLWASGSQIEVHGVSDDFSWSMFQYFRDFRPKKCQNYTFSTVRPTLEELSSCFVRESEKRLSSFSVGNALFCPFASSEGS